jgi:hypothetical protein
MIKLIDTKEERYCMIAMPDDFTTGQISCTGKSIVYKVSNIDGTQSPYKRIMLPFISKFTCSFISKRYLEYFDFDGKILSAIKIK